MVADPYSFDTDPDPAFWAEYRSGSSGFDDQKLIKKFTAEKNDIFLDKKLQIYLSLCIHKGRPSYKRSL
jgi:hypothetical protein